MRLLLKTFALLALFPYAGIVALLATGTASWSSVAYVAAAGLILGGLVTLPDVAAPSASADAVDASDTCGEKRRTRPRGLSRAGALALVAVMVARILTAGGGRETSGLHVGDAERPGGPARLVNRLVDEGDLATLGTRVLVGGRMLNDDRVELPASMRDAYAAMRREHGDAPSPVVATYLGLQGPSGFDLVVVEPPRGAGGAGPAPEAAVVFLHGYAGNFDLPCWQVARAVAPLDVLTACPSTRWIGDWWSAEGEATVRRTVDALRARGVTRFVLAGLSNGGYGASLLAPRMKGTFAGLVLLSGADPAAEDAGVPALLVHGTRDSMAGVHEARRYAAGHARARLVEVDAGHFAMLVRADEVELAIREFVAARLDARASL